jgi:hypothetical protein
MEASSAAAKKKHTASSVSISRINQTDIASSRPKHSACLSTTTSIDKSALASRKLICRSHIES